MSEWIIGLIDQWGYLGLFFLMLLESIFPPIPSELIMPFAGFAAARGSLTFPGVVVASTAGAVIGMVPWYLAGRLLGLERVCALADRHGRWLTLDAAELDRASDWFRRFGPLVVFFGRLMPIIRTVISVPAGLARVPQAYFFLASGLGALVWNTLLVSAGYLLNAQYNRVQAIVDPVTWIVLAGIMVLYVVRLFTWRPSRRT